MTTDLLSSFPFNAVASITTIAGDPLEPEHNAVADWMEKAKTLLERASARLDDADVPRDEHSVDEDTGEACVQHFDLEARIQRLADERDAKERDRQRDSDEANKYAGDLSMLHVRIRQAFGAESIEEAFELIAELKALQGEPNLTKYPAWRSLVKTTVELRNQLYERDAVIKTLQRAEVKNASVALTDAHAEIVDRDAYIEALEVEVHMLEQSLERAECSLEGERTGTRFATTTDSHEAILRAEIVVDVRSGKVVKNRRGPATPLSFDHAKTCPYYLRYFDQPSTGAKR